MINTAEVYLWGTRIGIIHKVEGVPYISFAYDHSFIKSGIEVSPIHMKLSDNVYEFPELVGDAFHGAPGLVADSLPDKFGNKIIERWLSEQGRTIEIIELHGSVELGPVIGLSDVILDIVESGSTLRANGLEIMEEVCDSSARLVCNRVSLKTKRERVQWLIDGISAQIMQ